MTTRVIQRTPNVGVSVRLKRLAPDAAPLAAPPACVVPCPDHYFPLDGTAADAVGNWSHATNGASDTFPDGPLYIDRPDWGQAIRARIMDEPYLAAAILSGPTTGAEWSLAMHLQPPDNGWTAAGSISVFELYGGSGTVFLSLYVESMTDWPGARLTISVPSEDPGEWITYPAGVGPADDWDRLILVSDGEYVRLQRGLVVLITAPVQMDLATVYLDMTVRSKVLPEQCAIDEIAIWNSALSLQDAARVTIADQPLGALCSS